jgi:hypothetical protein
MRDSRDFAPFDSDQGNPMTDTTLTNRLVIQSAVARLESSEYLLG